MIIKQGDMFEMPAEALVNTVNCVGVMGRGVALQFKKRFPDNFDAYREACKRGEVVPGKVFAFETHSPYLPRYIFNFPTKRHWRDKSRIEDIDAGLVDLSRLIYETGVHSIAIPPLGCGLGGLDWAKVRPLIESRLKDIAADVAINVYEPAPWKADQTKSIAPAKSDAISMTPGRAALIRLISKYLEGHLEPWATLLEVHKLLYFLQESGQPMRLTYRKAAFGPYAENLRHVLRHMEGRMLTGYDSERGDTPGQIIELVPGIAEEADHFLANDIATLARINRVGDLIDGYESPFGMELLATVHWVCVKENAATEAEAAVLVHNWNERKRKLFKPWQIQTAFETLVNHHWIQRD